MRRIITACAVALLIAGAAGCSKSQDEIAEDCRQAIDSTSTKTNRPDECKGLSDDNYQLLLMHRILVDQGLVDDDPNTEDTPEEITQRMLDNAENE